MNRLYKYNDAAQFTGEKKISLLLGQLSILSQPIKTCGFSHFLICVARGTR